MDIVYEVMHAAKIALVDSEGRVRISEFYLTADGEEIQLCMPPEEIRVKSSTNFRTFNVVESGEIKIPKGEQLTAISWRGTLPGAGVLLYSSIKKAAWDKPVELIKIINRWRERGTKLKLLITQTPVNLDVYVKSFDYTAKGGLGDYTYDINFVAAKPLLVRTVTEADAQRQQTGFELLTRATLKPRTGLYMTYLDTAWTVAQLLRGNGGDWQQLLDDNGISTPDAIDIGDVILN